MIKKVLYKFIRKVICSSMPELYYLYNKDIQSIGANGFDKQYFDWSFNRVSCSGTQIGSNVKLYPPYSISESSIGNYSYIARNSIISKTEIGRFCSIGPNLMCGWGIHPTTGLSTSPMFYSTMKQNGMTLSSTDKVEERKGIQIGNDVFIGANVTILDGVKIGDGAIIGAGAVVSKDIPPYAVAVGCPIRIIHYRFTEDKVEKLLKIKWWNFDDEQLKDVERMFFDVDEFLASHQQNDDRNRKN